MRSSHPGNQPSKFAGAKALSRAALFTCATFFGNNIHACAASPSASLERAVLTFALADAAREAVVLRKLYPGATFTVDRRANVIGVKASSNDVTSIRSVATALDVRPAGDTSVEPIRLQAVTATSLIARLHEVFREAIFLKVSEQTIIVRATQPVLSQIRQVVGAIDIAPAPPPAQPPNVTSVLHVSQANPRSVARALANALPTAKILVAGPDLLVSSTSETLAQAKALVEQLDRPSPSVRYPAVYRLANVDAPSVAAVLQRSYPALKIASDKPLNSITVEASTAEQSRIAEIVSQFDTSPASTSGNSGSGNFGSDFEVVSLRAAVPASGSGASSSASDIATTVSQAIAAEAPDLHITVQPNSTRLVLSGSARSRELARNLIAQLDVADPLVELDTRVVEVDEGAQSQLGLRFPTPVLSTTYSEVTPIGTTADPDPRLLPLQPLTRTPLSVGAELDFLLSTNHARLLEDPRITTFSGHTASLRAGETVNILTTTGGGTGTVATTQVQSFQTGVTLDITPVVNADDYITVTLHPSVNSVAGVGSSGVPNIQNRDTTTTIGLHDGETLVIGGLIEDTESKTIQKVPILGDLPLIGRLFQDVGVTRERNELVVTVTPHILRDRNIGSTTRLSLIPPAAPTALPTVDARATLSPETSHLSTVASALQPSPAAATSASPTPIVVPPAFDQTNVYVFGSAPANNFAEANQPPQIFYARVSPTVVKNGTPITISAITTTNVTSLTIGPSAQLQQFSLAPISPGKWQTTFNLDAARLPSTTGNVSEFLTATTASGNSTALRIPLSLSP